VFVKRFSEGDFVILLLYINDILIADSDIDRIKILKKELASAFVMKDLGAAQQILGMRVTRDLKNHKIWLS
jgi:Reverse transcriptase (RNA-dependent DNA polymerase)